MDRGDEKGEAIEVITLWKLFVDGAMNDYYSGEGVLLETPEGRSVCYALRLEFPSKNNEVKYEALIAGLRTAKELQLRALQIFSDSHIVVCQVKREF
jgi:ribonuclease HI